MKYSKYPRPAKKKFVSPYKYRKIAGGGTFKEWMPPNKVKPFIILWDRIKDKVGSYDEAVKAVKLGSDTVADMTKRNKLSVDTAQKILTFYNNLK